MKPSAITHPLPVPFSSLVVAGMTVLGLAACTKETPQAAWQDIRQVKLMAVQTAPAENLLVLPGEVHAATETPLAFRVSGKVSEKSVRLGDAVKAGQLIARLDASDYQAGSSAANAQVTAAAAERSQNGKDLVRYKALLDKGFISPAEFERRKTLLDTSNAQLDQTMANARTSQNQAGYTSLKAEYDGVISQLNLEPGQVVAAGQVIGKLSATGAKTLWISIPENRLADVKTAPGLTIKINALGNTAWAGVLSEVSPEADSTTRTFTAKVRLPDAAPAEAGMTGEVRIQARQPGSLPVIPLTALFNGGNGQGVWTYNTQTRQVHFVSIKTAGVNKDMVQVQSGLQNGQLIVVAGANLLHEGQKVRPAEDI
ncbi:efflux RND transporter periplasmic adaptor subunit [Leeia oryzae]|uniref:efflux RND transporter periplasmic adaptor subunit n=1 Tax=Leeia oryzae TaxID=356662 RepID=UPI0003821C85|nr:efflux RND transporter periplasmic adaptor subunit [Leeia oryzae]